VGGLTLGGGIGFLVRKHGLTIDHLRSAELVTAEGQQLTVSEREHPDLFWALRGGGGNFGVVTKFEFGTVPVGMIVGGAIVHEATPEVIQEYVATALRAPEELTTIAMVMRAPPLPFIPAEKHGALVLMILACYAGDPAAGMRALAPLRMIGPNDVPLGEHVGPMPYPALYSLTAEGAKSNRHSTRSGYARSMRRVLAEEIVAHLERATSPFAFVQLRPLGGAMARVPQEATAFVHRDKELLMVVSNAWDNPAQDEVQRAWVQGIWSAIQPHTQGTYVNFLEDEGHARIRDAYSASTMQRLAEIKRRYDPDNVFRSNQNVRPA
jgi:FAD/FMN-containing dehydrogenase